MGEKGWRFATSVENLPGDDVTPDPLHPGYNHIRDIYLSVDADYQGRFSVPMLWDKQSQTVVNNESAEIMRMLNTEFDGLLPDSNKSKVLNLLPNDLLSRIEETNLWIYEDINNGVYKCGFASTQGAYNRNVTQLFKSLDRAESDLAGSSGPFYFGDLLTETDIKLYTTLIRFDPVYIQHFKCNIRDIRSGYPNIHKWLRNLYWTIPAFCETTEFEHIRNHYTKSHKNINPSAITPVGPMPNILELEQEVGAVRKT
ncbi:ubiquitin-activating enzyme E1 [Exophiala aquamarina CBS 119918]|uniref:Ubiquitin-activating enzyme E1 n=1 Tax=Exophiala aquamarina CBS 119918 TaxID=1182545 RepID=A0A072NXW3_9EURO|nr:ubiquitin-activating enzyme E1 [Exophiala aquamarina CBS 119918]KEF52252.1 ubiquitin-activating enzyme E1 [Exophiala aquamarina CBS 119918]